VLPNITVGGTQGYKHNVKFPCVTAACGAAWSACATACAPIYPEPVAGNGMFVINSDDSSTLGWVGYSGTAWSKV
jgi:hypothetical protein